MLAGEGVFTSASGVVAEIVGGASRRIKSGEDIVTGFLVWFGYSEIRRLLGVPHGHAMQQSRNAPVLGPRERC